MAVEKEPYLRWVHGRKRPLSMFFNLIIRQQGFELLI